VRTGTLQTDLYQLLNHFLPQVGKLFVNEKEREINLLELRIQELTHLITQYKKK